MKKLLYIFPVFCFAFLLCSAHSAHAQVTKLDFTYCLAQSKLTTFENIEVQRRGKDASSLEKVKIEFRENAIYITDYNDKETKQSLRVFEVIPYKSISTFFYLAKTQYLIVTVVE